MKKFLSTHLPTARSLAGIAHEILLETREAAATKVSDLRSQVNDLWEAAGEEVRTRPARLKRQVKTVVEALRHRDMIAFPVLRRD